MLRTLIGLMGLCSVLTLHGCAPLAPGFYDATPVDEPGRASCVWTRQYSPPIVYQESDFIRGYFEPADLAAYQLAIPAPFTIPPRPLERVAPAIWKVRLGEARLEFPHEQENLLNRLGIGPPLAAYWGRMRYRFTITPR